MWQSNRLSHEHQSVKNAFCVTHSFSISPAWGCFIFLALSISRNRSFRSPSARPKRSAVSFWCCNFLLFFLLSESWAKGAGIFICYIHMAYRIYTHTLVYKFNRMCYLTMISSSSARSTSFSTVSAFFCIRAISKARLLACDLPVQN